MLELVEGCAFGACAAKRKPKWRVTFLVQMTPERTHMPWRGYGQKVAPSLPNTTPVPTPSQTSMPLVLLSQVPGECELFFAVAAARLEPCEAYLLAAVEQTLAFRGEYMLRALDPKRQTDVLTANSPLAKVRLGSRCTCLSSCRCGCRHGGEQVHPCHLSQLLKSDMRRAGV